MGLLSPTLALGVVLSTAYAALFHFLSKGDVPALRNYLLAAWLGFAVGQVGADLLGLYWLQVGHLNLLSGTLGAAAALGIAKALEA